MGVQTHTSVIPMEEASCGVYTICTTSSRNVINTVKFAPVDRDIPHLPAIHYSVKVSVQFCTDVFSGMSAGKEKYVSPLSRALA